MTLPAENMILKVFEDLEDESIRQPNDYNKMQEYMLYSAQNYLLKACDQFAILVFLWSFHLKMM